MYTTVVSNFEAKWQLANGQDLINPLWILKQDNSLLFSPVKQKNYKSQRTSLKQQEQPVWLKIRKGKVFQFFRNFLTIKTRPPIGLGFPQTEGTNTTSAVIFSKMDYHIINKIKSRKKDNFSQSLATKD